MLLIRPLNGMGFLTGNWHCYQAIVEALFHNAQPPRRVTESKATRTGQVARQKSWPGTTSAKRIKVAFGIRVTLY